MLFVTYNGLLRLRKNLPELVHFLTDEDVATWLVILEDARHRCRTQVVGRMPGLLDDQPMSLAYWVQLFKYNPEALTPDRESRLKYLKNAKASMELNPMLEALYMKANSRREKGQKP